MHKIKIKKGFCFENEIIFRIIVFLLHTND